MPYERVLYAIGSGLDHWAVLKSIDPQSKLAILELLGGARDSEIVRDVREDQKGSKGTWHYPKGK